MNDKKLYSQILGVVKPWHVSDVIMEISKQQILVKVDHFSGASFTCPTCGKKSPIYDHRVRRWRHLPTCHLRTIIETRSPRVKCPEHGVLQTGVPWAEDKSSFTAMFEALVIDWLKEANISAVSRLMDLSWDQIDTIRSRAVQRGISRRETAPPEAIGIDETSFRKRHDYVTVVVDQKSHAVVEVIDERKQESLQHYFSNLSQTHKAKLKTIAMDMWDPYIAAVRSNFDDWQKMICFDRYHVSSYFNNAVDKTRIQEHKEHLQGGDGSVLSHTKHHWLMNSSRIDNRSRRWFVDITKMNLKTSRAWSIKEVAGSLWRYINRTVALKVWNRLLGWMIRSRLPAMVKLAATIRRYLWGIINAIIHNVTNAASEGINSRIQWIKKMACGYRNKNRFKEAILFHLGKLDMLPRGAHITHLNP